MTTTNPFIETKTVQFRWPVKQISETEIVVEVPMTQDEPLIRFTAWANSLSDSEIARAIKVAQDAIIQDLMIIK